MKVIDEAYKNKIIYTLYFLAAAVTLFFIISGTNELLIIGEIIEKMTTINFTLAIGYAALVSALAAISTTNIRSNSVLKKEIADFIKMIIAYVLGNVIIVSLTFDIAANSPILMRTLIGLMIALILILSHILLNLTNKLLK